MTHFSDWTKHLITKVACPDQYNIPALRYLDTQYLTLTINIGLQKKSLMKKRIF